MKPLSSLKEGLTYRGRRLESLLGKDVKRRIEVYPFQANKAVWWPECQKELSLYLKLKRGFFESGVALDFEEWRSNINSADSVIKCCNSWIKILGLSWNLWSLDNFKVIGAQCGGLLEVSEDTRSLRDLGAARIKVKGTKDGFINNKITIPLNGVNTELTIIPLTFDSKAYESYEKQTYAQVVISGKRTVAGWGNSNIGRTMDNEGTPPHIHKALIEEVQGLQSTFKEDGEKSFLPAVQANKVVKIIQRISPKQIEDFRRSPVHSLSNGEDKEMSSIENENGQNSESHTFRLIKCRNSNTATKDVCELIEVGGKVNDDVLIMEDSSKTGSFITKILKILSSMIQKMTCWRMNSMSLNRAVTRLLSRSPWPIMKQTTWTSKGCSFQRKKPSNSYNLLFLIILIL
ncbi:uncharacterized protein LOC142541110 [Primulina tabacum]|uniref:uncharacterized protein LOC142541110 n=1 Tax=Primulina tabacum TaxID=48773 RepID=UPI003F59B9E1